VYWIWRFIAAFIQNKCCSILQTGHITLSSTSDHLLETYSTKNHTQQPLYNTLELLLMGIVVPETCSASNKICNKKPLLHLVGILFPHIRSTVSPCRVSAALPTYNLPPHFLSVVSLPNYSVRGLAVRFQNCLCLHHWRLKPSSC